MQRTLKTAWMVILTAGVMASGCGGPAKSQPVAQPTTNAGGGGSTAGGTDPPSDATVAGKRKLEFLKPFDAPPLEKLLAENEWVEMPVLDSMQLRREFEQDKKPPLSVAEALGLKNTSAETNAKILGTLGLLPKSDAEVDFEASITRRMQQEPESLNPILSNSVSEAEILNLTGFGLFSFDWRMNPFASKDSVVSWKSSKDGLIDVVVMRDDLTWSDGKPITAHDVEYSFQTIMDPRIDVPAQRTGTDKLRWVKAYDDHTVVFFHKEALATNIWNVNFSIIPKHIYEKTIPNDYTIKESKEHVALNEKPIVGGAYEVAERVRGQHIVLQRRESYYMHNGKQVRDKPYFKQIRFRILPDPNTAILSLIQGEIGEAELSAAQWQTQTGDDNFYKHNTKVTGSEWTFFYFGWNMATPYFRDVRVRRAMGLAFDHDEMLRVHCYGLYQPCASIFHPDSWMMAEAPKLAPYKQDLDKAEALLDEAGWVDTDGDGTRDKVVNGQKVQFSFTMIVRNSADRVAICELLKQNLHSIGVKMNILPLETATLQARMQKREYEANFGGWGTGADPDTSENIWGTGQERNYANYSNNRVDELFSLGRKEFDRKKRAAAYAEIAQIVYNDQPYTFLYYQNSFYAFNKQLRGYMFSPRGPFHYGPGFSAIWPAAN